MSLMQTDKKLCAQTLGILRFREGRRMRNNRVNTKDGKRMGKVLLFPCYLPSLFL